MILAESRFFGEKSGLIRTCHESSQVGHICVQQAFVSSKRQDALFYFIRNSNFEIVGLQEVSFSASPNDYFFFIKQRTKQFRDGPSVEKGCGFFQMR